MFHSGGRVKSRPELPSCLHAQNPDGCGPVYNEFSYRFREEGPSSGDGPLLTYRVTITTGGSGGVAVDEAGFPGTVFDSTPTSIAFSMRTGTYLPPLGSPWLALGVGIGPSAVGRGLPKLDPGPILPDVSDRQSSVSDGHFRIRLNWRRCTYRIHLTGL
jgi:hypothetical protein